MASAFLEASTLGAAASVSAVVEAALWAVALGAVVLAVSALLGSTTLSAAVLLDAASLGAAGLLGASALESLALGPSASGLLSCGLDSVALGSVDLDSAALGSVTLGEASGSGTSDAAVSAGFPSEIFSAMIEMAPKFWAFSLKTFRIAKTRLRACGLRARLNIIFNTRGPSSSIICLGCSNPMGATLIDSTLNPLFSNSSLHSVAVNGRAFTLIVVARALRRLSATV